MRDFLLRRKPKDIDIATSARPDEVLRLFPHSLAIGAQFGVIQVRLYGHAYEVATFRKDNAYVDGRHPSSVEFSGPEQDALRRDFTINGLFYDPATDRLIDYVRGKGDIQNKIIRTIGDASARFTEDKLRMLRAIRLSCNLGFAIADDTWNALQELAPGILQVSWERIRDELAKLFTGPSPGKGLDLLQAGGLLIHILPEIESLRGIPFSPRADSAADAFAHTRAALDALRKPSTILAFGTLLHAVGRTAAPIADSDPSPDEYAMPGASISRSICRRLRMSNEETDRIADLVYTHMELQRFDTMRESTRQRLLRKEHIEDHLELLRASSQGNKRRHDLYWNCLRKVKEYQQTPSAPPLIGGDDLIALGYHPGPIFSRILQTVEDLQLEGVLHTREEALEHIRSQFPFSGENQS